MKTSWNKGKKLTDYPQMGFQKGHSFFPGGEKGWFKKGQAGHTIPHTEVSKEKNRIAHIGKGIGANNPSWKGGVTPLLNKIKRLTEYKGFQEGVLKRDNFTCRKCLKRGGNLTAHHLTAFSFLIQIFKIRSVQDAKECFLIWNIRNGVTLCEWCHAGTSNFGWRAVETPKDRAFYPKIILGILIMFLLFPSPSYAVTFGYTTLGATSNAIANSASNASIRKGMAVSGNAGTLDSISAGMKVGTGSETIDTSVFLNIENTATDSLTQVVAIERTALTVSTTATFYTFTAGSESISAIEYVISALADGADLSGATNVSLLSDSSGTRNNYSESGAFPNGYANRKESPWTVLDTSGSIQYSLYATYSTGGGGGGSAATPRGSILDFDAF